MTVGTYALKEFRGTGTAGSSVYGLGTFKGTLKTLSDVTAITNPSNGQVLTYDTTDGTGWRNKAPSAGSFVSLSDVNISSLTAGKYIKVGTGSELEEVDAPALTNLSDVNISQPYQR